VLLLWAFKRIRNPADDVPCQREMQEGMRNRGSGKDVPWGMQLNAKHGRGPGFMAPTLIARRYQALAAVAAGGPCSCDLV
jgi:hypothetical protein